MPEKLCFALFLCGAGSNFIYCILLCFLKYILIYFYIFIYVHAFMNLNAYSTWETGKGH